jgi:hypothetical protein
MSAFGATSQARDSASRLSNPSLKSLLKIPESKARNKFEWPSIIAVVFLIMSKSGGHRGRFYLGEILEGRFISGEICSVRLLTALRELSDPSMQSGFFLDQKHAS